MYTENYNVYMEKPKPSFVRILPNTRQRLKVLAAQRNMSMQQLIENLLQAEIAREQQRALEKQEAPVRG
jgi:hypothetical protein